MPGWTSVIVVVCVIGGAILMSIGVLGEYVARIYEESKGRPLYIVASSANMTERNGRESAHQHGDQQGDENGDERGLDHDGHRELQILNGMLLREKREQEIPTNS